MIDGCNQPDEPYLEIIYENEHLFLDTFAPDASDLVEVHFSSTNFKKTSEREFFVL